MQQHSIQQIRIQIIAAKYDKNYKIITIENFAT